MGISTSVLQEDALCELGKGPFNNYVDKMRWAKMPVFVHAQGVKTVHARRRGGELKNGKNLST